MIINIDCREKSLISEIGLKEIDPEISVKTEELDIGDIVISDGSGNELVIIERKTVSDLASSIVDGRYKEQSYRLDGNKTHNHNVIYLIEGSIAGYKSSGRRIGKNALYSSLFSLMYYKGFSVIRSSSVQETSEILVRIADLLRRSKNKLGYYNGNAEKITYTDAVKSEKKKNITTDNIGEIMLKQIPGVSPNIAKLIMSKYKTIINLIDTLKNDSNALKEMAFITSAGKPRKISKTSIININKYLGIV